MHKLNQRPLPPFRAEAALKFWGVTGDLSAEVKSSMETVNKHANVEVSLFYKGDIGKAVGHTENTNSKSADGAFQQVKQWFDQFLSTACSHQYNYRSARWPEGVSLFRMLTRPPGLSSKNIQM
ncbi:hypothetical protein CDD83_5183 [Cordyceps sp. RAO-2017]|nr:hypothetical protein CDD83_5183 [Cordyceps sp. RAO-2017]